jgi:hypothetical protein
VGAPEVWLRGPIEGVAAPMQPLAHAVLQAREEIHVLAATMSDDILWTRPAGVASAGFHLRHIPGVLDRLTTYARGETLSDAQRAYLASEAAAPPSDAAGVVGNGTGNADVARLVALVDQQIEQFVDALRVIDEHRLFDVRLVGRAQLPSTVIGLLFHAAEHTQRHLGQLLVTVRVQQHGPATPTSTPDPAQ